jgi:hypothetical protein
MDDDRTVRAPASNEHTPEELTPALADTSTDTSADVSTGRAGGVGSDFLWRDVPQARAGGAATLSERLRRRAAYHADDTRPTAPRDRTATTSKKLAQQMEIVTDANGRRVVQIPADAWEEVAEEEAANEVPEEEYNADDRWAAWSALSSDEKAARVTEAQEALDTLNTSDRPIIERTVLLVAYAHQGMKAANQRTRQYCEVGDRVIAEGRDQGATFTSDHFEALLFAMDDELDADPSRRMTHAMLEQSDAIVLGHEAVLTTGGTPVMPDDFATMAGDLYREPVSTAGHFGVMSRDLDDDGNLRSGAFLWRNFRVAWRRWGPLAVLGVGWLWAPIYSRAEMLRQMAANTGAPAPVRRVAASRGIFFGLTAAVTLLLLAGLVALVLNISTIGKLATNLGHGLTSTGGTTLGDCSTCPTLTPLAPTATHDPTQPYPTATAPGSGGCDSACGSGQPTPTHPAGPTPTPVPTKPSDVFASSGVVTFTRASNSASSPATLTASDGSTNSPSAGTQRGQKIAGSADGASGTFGNVWTKYANATYTVFKVTYACLSGPNGCFTAAGTHIYDQSGNGHDCHLLVDAFADAGGFDYPTCQVYTAGNITAPTTVYYPYHPPTGSGSAQMQSIVQTMVQGHGDLYAWYTPSGCTGQGSAAAQSAATAALNNALNGGLGTVAIGLQSSISSTWCSYPGNCGQSVGSGQSMGSTSSYQVCSTATGWKFTVSLGDSSGVQTQRIGAPSGYAVDSSTVQGCTPNIQSVNIGAVSATIACQAHATARAVFDSATKSAIANQCAGKLVSEVASYVAGYPGVGGGVTLSYNPSNANRFPQSGGAITINAT